MLPLLIVIFEEERYDISPLRLLSAVVAVIFVTYPFLSAVIDASIDAPSSTRSIRSSTSFEDLPSRVRGTLL